MELSKNLWTLKNHHTFTIMELASVSSCTFPFIPSSYCHQYILAGKQIWSCSKVGDWDLKNDGRSGEPTGQVLEPCKILLSSGQGSWCLRGGSFNYRTLLSSGWSLSFNVPRKLKLSVRELRSRVDKSAQLNQPQRNVTAHVRQKGRKWVT